MPIQKLERTLKEVIKKILLFSLLPLVFLKWQVDKRFLPLTALHRKLYFKIHLYYFLNLLSFPNLISPKSFNDKIQWLKIFDQKKLYIKTSDKIDVRKFIKDELDSRYDKRFLKIFKQFSDPEDILGEVLPNVCVLKASHDSGSVFVVKDGVNKESLIDKLKESKARPHGWVNGEWNYIFIKPKFFIEEYFEPDSGLLPTDYKFHCVDGEVIWVQYIYDRESSPKEVILSPNGEPIGVTLDHQMRKGVMLEKPRYWREMEVLASKISASFKYSRIDFLCSSDNFYFGEITLYPLMGFYKGSGQRELGRLMDFSLDTYSFPIFCKLYEDGMSKKIFPSYNFD